MVIAEFSEGHNEKNHEETNRLGWTDQTADFFWDFVLYHKNYAHIAEFCPIFFYMPCSKFNHSHFHRLSSGKWN